MTSLWRHLQILTIATLPLKWSSNEQRAVIRFFVGQKINVSEIHLDDMLKNETLLFNS